MQDDCKLPAFEWFMDMDLASLLLLLKVERERELKWAKKKWLRGTRAMLPHQGDMTMLGGHRTRRGRKHGLGYSIHTQRHKYTYIHIDKNMFGRKMKHSSQKSSQHVNVKDPVLINVDSMWKNNNVISGSNFVFFFKEKYRNSTLNPGKT